MTYSLSAAAVQSVSDEHGPTFTIPSTEVASPPPIPFPFTIKAGVVLSRPPVITRDLHPFEKSLLSLPAPTQRATGFTIYPLLLLPERYARRPRLEEEDPRTHHTRTRHWHLQRLGQRGLARRGARRRHGERALVADGSAAARRRQGGAVGRSGGGEPRASGDGGAAAAARDGRRPDGRYAQLEPGAGAHAVLAGAGRGGDLGVSEREAAGGRELAEGTIRHRKGEDGWLTMRQAAERILVQAGGINMNTWIVGHTPVGMYRHKFLTSHFFDEEKTQPWKGEKTFFMKGRIMAGQANLAKNEFGLRDFQWLAKDELQKQVPARYWNEVHNMLVER